MTEPSSPSRILLVRLGALGDIVHAIPVAAALRRALPAARLDWLVSARHRPLLDLVPVIDRRIVLGEGAAMLATVRELRRERYDVAIDLQGLLKSAVLARLSGAPRVIGLGARFVRESLARPFYTETYEPAGRVHILLENLSLLEPFGIRDVAPEFPIDIVSSDVAREAAARSGGRYAVLNPGAAWPNKRWPPARLGAIAQRLRDRYGLTSVVVWGPGEERLAAEVQAASNGAAFVSPPTSLVDLIALLRGAAVMVSGDTGPTHLAAAVGTPIVGIYGPTRPARNGPWSPADEVVSRDGRCGCHHKRRCTQPVWCLGEIGVDEIAAAIDRRLARGAPRARVSLVGDRGE